MTFNLFQLHSEEDKPKCWIWAEIDTKPIRKEILRFFEDNAKNETARRISKKLNCGFSTIVKHLIKITKNEKVRIPLPVIGELIEIINPKLKKQVVELINLLWVNSNKTKTITLPTEMNHVLAKIIGAHLADGYLQKTNTSYKIKISDGRKDNIGIFKKWIKKTFDSRPWIRFSTRDNTWTLWYSNKVVGRYYEKIFNIKPGKKSHIAKEPQIIKDSSLDIRNAFALGVMTFDGGVKTSGMISILSKSKKLVSDLEEIFKLNNIQMNKRYNHKNSMWSLESKSGRDTLCLKRWQNFFEDGSWKRKRLDFFIYKKNYSIKEIEYLFPNYYNNKVGINDILNAISYIKFGKINDIQGILKTKDIKVADTTLYKKPAQTVMGGGEKRFII